MLYKGDHTHRLPEVLADDEPQTDGDASPGKQGANQPIRCLTPGNTPQLAALAEDLGATSLNGNGSPRRNASPVRRRTTRRLTNMMVMSEQDFTTRQKALRSSFRLEASAIEAAMLRLRRWQMLSDLGVTPSFRNSSVQHLMDTFEESYLGIAAVRSNRLARDSSLASEVEPDGHDDDRAPRVEVACSVAVLNFVRWLCGLPPVQNNGVRVQVCDVISQALLPRAPESTKLGRGPITLGKAIAALVEARSDRISVFHGEASLVVAIEKCLGATHMLSAPAPHRGQDREALARNLATAVESRQSVQSGWIGDTVLEVPAAAQRKNNKLMDPPSPMLGISELPSALQPLRVLWELQPHQHLKLKRRFTKGQQSSITLAPEPRPSETTHAHTPRESKQNSLPKQGAEAKPRRQRGTAVDDNHASAYGLSSIWGDRRGALGFRRCLLSPSLQAFGAARRHDTCVLWTGTDRDLDTPGDGLSPPTTESPMQHDAVCYPPPGLVPLMLLEGGRTPWTIMPDSTRFQPTANTKVRAFRVKIDRSGKEWSAERTDEVSVNGLAIDCSTRGEPFCVIFWPGIGQPTVGDQLEVELTGLCGSTHTLHFFYEVHSFVQQDLDYGLYVEAANIRKLLGDSSIWSEANSGSAAPLSPTQMPSALSRGHVQHGHRMSSINAAPGFANGELPEIEAVSHPVKTISTNNVDVKIVLRCKSPTGLSAELYIIRFGEDEELVPHGTQVQRLAEGCILVRCKMPMARCRYELRFWVSSAKEPSNLHQHHLKYLITTGEQCQTLLSSLEDPLVKMFGLADITPMAQHHGLVVLSPMTHRIVAGQTPTYFLVYLNQAAALKQAHSEVSNMKARAPSKDADKAALIMNKTMMEGGTTTTLFSHRLLPKEMGRGGIQLGQEVADMHECLRSTLEPHCQDSQGEIHLDLALQGGGCLRQLRERCDFPGLYEGLVLFSDHDAGKSLRLMLRFPQAHRIEYAPRSVCEWMVCRGEHFPINF